MTIQPSDIEILLGRDLTDDENDRVERLIELAEGAVEDALPGFSIATGIETVEITSDDPDTLWTPRYPVTALAELAVDDITVDATFYRVTRKGRITLIPDGTPWIANGPDFAPWFGGRLTVSYDYGLDPPPPAIVNAVASLVAQQLRAQSANPAGAMSYSIGSYSEAHGVAGQAALAAGMVVIPTVGLRRWSRTGHVSVPLTRTR